MGIDLHRAFEDAAERGTAQRPDLAAGPVLRRIHHRRAARAATSSAVGLAAVAAVTLGGLQLAQRTDEPPVAPEPTTSPSPVTPTPTPTPSAEPQAPVLPACGARTDALTGSAGDVLGEPWVQVGVVDTGDGTFLPEGYGDRLLLGFTPRGSEPAGTSDGGSAVVARDGVVVATYPGIDLLGGEQLVELVDCADGSYPGPGDYVLWTASIAPSTGAGPEPLLWGVHSPVPFTVFEFEDPDNLGAVRWTPQGPRDVDGEDPVASPPPDQPEPSALTLTAAGLAGLPLGSVLDPTAATNPVVRWDPAVCAGTDVPGRWVAAGDDVELADGGAGPLVEPLVFEERLVRLDVLGSAVRTPEGLGVGSTLEEVRAVHDVRLLQPVAPGDVVEAWGVVDGERTLVFEIATDAGGLDAWPSARKGTVAAIAVLQGLPYGSPAWGGDRCG